MSARPATAGRRARLLILNPYYWSGFEATGHLLSELRAGLADEFEVTVVAGTLQDPPAPPGRYARDGVRIVGVRSTSFERSRLSRRAANYLTYLAASLRAGLRAPRPREALPLSLSSADVHVVGLARGLAGYVVPSRLYGVLATGKPVVVAADKDSETARLVSSIDAGVVVPPGRLELLARVIRSAHEGQLDLEGMGRRARDYVVAEAARRVAVSRYRELLHGLAGA